MSRLRAGLLVTTALYWLLGVGGCGVNPPIDPEAETLRQITNDSYSESGLCWSPDGARIGYACQKTANYGLFVVDLATKAITDLASAAGDYMDPDWAPSGDSIVAAYVEGGESSLRGVSYPGGSAGGIYISCAAANDGCEMYPTWSYLGGQLAMLINDAPACMRYFGNIYTVTLGNYGCTSVATLGYGDGNLDLNWANGSNRLAYSYNVSATEVWRIRVLSIDGGTSYDLVPGASRDFCPDWSPSDSHICFVSNRGGTVDIWVARADNSAPAKRLTNDADAESCPRWSPDGKRIAFISDHGGQNDIWTIPVPASTVD